MKYDLDNYLEIIMLNIFTVSLSILIFMVLKLNYNLAASYCNANDIPLDFILPTSGVSLVFGITILLFVIELIEVFCLFKLLKKVPFINSFYNY